MLTLLVIRALPVIGRLPGARGTADAHSIPLLRWSDLWYFAPFVPFVLAAGFVGIFRHMLAESQTPKELQRERQKELFRDMTGFTFAGLVAVAVVDNAAEKNLSLTIYFLLVGFLLFFAGHLYVGFATTRGENILLLTLEHAGSLGLLLGATAVIRNSEPTFIGTAFTVLSLAMWGFNFSIEGRNKYVWLNTVLEIRRETHTQGGATTRMPTKRNIKEGVVVNENTTKKRAPSEESLNPTMASSVLQRVRPVVPLHAPASPLEEYDTCAVCHKKHLVGSNCGRSDCPH